MKRTQNYLKVRRSLQVGAVVGGLMVGAYGQGNVPDAQVESNVLKALASAPELANESITTRTVYGTVTLSGSVRDEATRRRAEALASNADGVRKVVDELQLGSAAAATAGPATGAGQVLQSDGTYAPAGGGAAAGPAPGSASAEQAQRNDPDADQQLDQQMQPQSGGTNGISGQNAPGGQTQNGANGQGGCRRHRTIPAHR